MRLLAKSLIQGCILSFAWTFPHTLRLLVNTSHCSVLWKLLSCAVARQFYPLKMESGFISDLRSALSSSRDLKGQLLCCSLPGDCDYWAIYTVHTLTGHFKRRILLVYDQTYFAFRAALNLHGSDSMRCWKHLSETWQHHSYDGDLFSTLATVLFICCRHLNCVYLKWKWQLHTRNKKKRIKVIRSHQCFDVDGSESRKWQM